MSKKELDSIEELIIRKIQLAEVCGGLSSSDKKFISLWSYMIELQNNWNELKKWLEEQISINTPNARWKHHNEDGINDYDMVNGNYIKAQSVNVTMKETLNKMQYLEGKNE